MNDVITSQLCREFIAEMTVAGAGEIAASCADTLMKWGFFTRPASTKWHGTRKGDLFLHSKNVARELKRITDACGIKWQNPRSPILVGYFHDLCKCDQYEWDPQESRWEWRKEQLLRGHGDKSVMLASTLCQLTEEEMLCIRYHMGAYNTDDWDGFDRAIKKYETVLWTHTADMIASKVGGI